MMVELWLMDKILHDPKVTLNYGNYGIFLIMGRAGFCPSNRMAYLENLECGRCGEFRESLGSLNEFGGRAQGCSGFRFLHPNHSRQTGCGCGIIIIRGRSLTILHILPTSKRPP